MNGYRNISANVISNFVSLHKSIAMVMPCCECFKVTVCTEKQNERSLHCVLVSQFVSNLKNENYSVTKKTIYCHCHCCYCCSLSNMMIRKMVALQAQLS
jgi:hypothetical protein